MKSLFTFVLSLFLVIVSISSCSNACSVKSPNKDLSVCVSISETGNLQYSFSVKGTEIISKSTIGFSETLGEAPVVESITPSGKLTKVRSQWIPLWGKRSVVPELYNSREYTLNLGQSKTATLQVRAYNEGVAYRISLPMPEKMYEYAEFNFSGDYTAWYYNGERHNIGPEPLSDADGERLPTMTIKVKNDLYLAVHEASLGYNSWPMRLQSEKGSTRFSIIPEAIDTSELYTSAWRVVMYADTPGGLVDSHLLELLNPEAEGDFSWVKPGVALWDWRIDGAQWEDYSYGMNYDSWTRMIDFASEQGFSHLVLDANWYGPEFAKDSDPVKGDKAKDVQRIIQYGKEKGVGVWLYLNDVAGTQYPIEETLSQYESWGAAGVKYGFMFGQSLFKNRKTLDITALCAKHHLLVDYHDYPVHPFGQMRTYPNAITREFCKAQLDGHEIFYPKTFVTSVFVNMVAGPVDMNNGFLELHQGRTTRKDNNQEVPSTVTGEIARTLITWSGATVIPDIPEYYRKYPQLLEFLSSEKQPWKESITLDGEIGEYIVMMRQNSDGNFLVAAATNEDERTLSIPMSFLPKGRWAASINTDAEDTHYLTNRETTTNSSSIVDSKSSISVRLAPGGGACILLKQM